MTNDVSRWWNSLRHGGMLISPSRLNEYFNYDLEPLKPWITERLRRDITRLKPGKTETESALIDTVLKSLCGIEEKSGTWTSGSSIDSKYSQKLVTGEEDKPRRVWISSNGDIFPIFVDKEKRLGIGRGRRGVSKVIEWLRKANLKIALLTNARQFRLIYAGFDHDAWVEWDTELFFEEGVPSFQVDALQMLISPYSLSSTDGKDSPLLSAILESRKGEAELSQELGENVRLAVEKLIKAHAPVLNELADYNIKDIHKHIYLAATRIIMRMVVILFAEARELLPRDNQVYNASYSLQGLREQLDRVGSGHAAGERLKNRNLAWPRILALFNIIYNGSAHVKLPITKYGGGLFEPGNPDSDNPVLKAIYVFESACFEPNVNTINDLIVQEILTLLTRTKVKVRQGRTSTWVTAPVDFSNLSSEYIGIIYEGLLDYELKQAKDHSIIFLNIGDQPALPLDRLEQMSDDQLANLVEKLKKKTRLNLSEESEEGGDEDESDEESEIEEDVDEIIVGEDPRVFPDSESLPDETIQPDKTDDARKREYDRALNWAVKAVKAGKLVHKPKSKKKDAIDAYENAVCSYARFLINKLFLPGEWYLVRWGGTRKGSGTFYTRPQLAFPLVQRTLRPLAYLGAHSSRGHSDIPSTNTDETPSLTEEYTPKLPEEILALKVCDPAMGSGSFLVGATRFLTDALYESLHHHQRIKQSGDGSLIKLADGKSSNGDLSDDLLPCRPDDDNFEPLLRARLKRYIVERCIYGIDIDPLAVELARLSLWVETMDRNLPFEFLDHKLKVGNSLIGCWFDRYPHYPALAWAREGGDKNHTNGVLYKKEQLTKKIKEIFKDFIKPEIAQFIHMTRGQGSLPFGDEYFLPDELHEKFSEYMNQIHELAIDYEGNKQREKEYYEAIQSEGFRDLKSMMDTWCAIWFWPLEELDNSDNYSPVRFPFPERDTLDISEKLALKLKFFHWEMEFPDVFTERHSGFDAVIGNPPWNIMKPNSKEFFSNYDPLYRTYGKQEALNVQKHMFETNSEIEKEWLSYIAQFKAMSNWVKYSADPYQLSIGRGKDYEKLMEDWEDERKKEKCFCDPSHPFSHQGSADINSYKLFLELAHTLLKDGGQLGLIVPSGVYTDKGTTDIRKLFINQCSWEWLFGFENRDKVFDIDSRFKFCPVIVQKGGSTENIRTAFMRRNLKDWEDGEKYVIPYSKEQVTKFSPKSGSLLEINSERDLEILNKIYSNSVLLGDDSPDGWGIQYATEFHMTNDSKLFPPRSKWEADGYKPDIYGRWIGPDGDVALPLYQGVMIWQFDFCATAYVRGAGNRANWNGLQWGEKTVLPQFLLSEKDLINSPKYAGNYKVAYRRISDATNERTVIAAFIDKFPAGDSVFYYSSLSESILDVLNLVGLFDSLIFDYQMRTRLSGNNLSAFRMDETALTAKFANTIEHKTALLSIFRLALPDILFAHKWMQLKNSIIANHPWKKLWAITPHERLRLRSMLDAIIAELYGLDYDDFAYILKDCDHPTEQSTSKSFTRALDPKGFWRVDKEKDPELRHTVLSLVAFRDLKDTIKNCGGDRDKGIESFCSQNDGDGWFLPDTLTLADYEFQHSNEKDYVIPDRAKRPQPVASILGERFLPWQLEQTVEESWKECEIHARNILGEEGFNDLMSEIRGEKKPQSEPLERVERGKSKRKKDQQELFD